MHITTTTRVHYELVTDMMHVNTTQPGIDELVSTNTNTTNRVHCYELLM